MSPKSTILVCRLATLCLVFVSFHFKVTAQAPDTLSLERALAIAEERNPAVAVGALDIRQSEARLRELTATRYPSLLLRSHYLHAPETGYNEIVTNGGEYGLQVSAAVPLYDGGVRGLLEEQTSNNIERASLALDKRKSETALAVRLVYYELLRAGEEVAVRAGALDDLNEYIRLLGRLRLGGSATQSDILKAQVDANRAGVLLEEAREAVVRAKRQLGGLLALPAGRLVEALPVTDTLPVPSFSVDDNPDLRLLLYDEKSAAVDVAIASAERRPTLSVVGDAGALGVTPNEFHEDLGYSVLLSLEMPLFNWGATGERIEQKEAGREQAAALAALERRDLETEWAVTADDLARARANLGILHKSIADAGENFIAAKSRFAGGSGSSLEVLDAARLLTDAKVDLAASLYRLRSDAATLLKLAGKR